MNWRQFFGWTLVVLLVIIELAGVTCLVLAYRYNRSLEESASVVPTETVVTDTLVVVPEPKAVEFSIVVAGDAMMHMPQLYLAMLPDGTYSFDTCYHAIAPVLARYDAAVVNLETTLPGGGYSGFPRVGWPTTIVATRIGVVCSARCLYWTRWVYSMWASIEMCKSGIVCIPI